MGVMRKNLLLVLALFTLVCVRANADVTPAQITDPEYMINGGYSEATAEQVLIQKNRSDGKPCEPLYEKKYNNKFVNFLRNSYSYLDPSIDNDDRYHHDIHQSPNWHDL